MSENQKNTQLRIGSLSRLDAHHRLFVSLGVAALVGSLCYFTDLGITKRLLLPWDSFALCLLALAWARIATAQPKTALRTARLQHSARTGIFLFVLAAACASLAAVFFVLTEAKAIHANGTREHMAVALVAMVLTTVVLSWALIHTVFALQYAYLYYCRHPAGSGAALIFPEGTSEPDYYDFAYFSFIIGITSQVSDIQIASKEVRRWALLHGLIAFAFNTAVLALGINVVSGFF